MTITVVVQKRTACAPAGNVVPQARWFGHIGERPVAIVPIELVLAKVSAEQIFKAIIIIVADTDARGPADVMQAGFLGDVGERAIPIVLVKPVTCARWRARQASTAEDKNIHPAV